MKVPRDDWKLELEKVLREIPGYNPWNQADDSWLDHAAALKAINWFAENLKHIEGSTRGQPFILGRWQAAVIGNLFGWKRKDDANRIVRRYRKSLMMIGRGNGKTPFAAGIVLYAFFEDGEKGAQNYLAAGAANQAGYLFRNARGMVEQNDELKDRVSIYGGDQHRSLVLKDDPLSFCKVIPAEAAGQHGGIPHVTVVDELHVQESRDLLDVFETAMAKKVRANPLLVMITTADFDRPSICNEMHDYAIRVRDNGGDPEKPGYDPSFLPVIYAADREDDWLDEKVWAKANPNLDVSVSRESLRSAAKKAQEQPASENAFRRLHLNQRTSQDTRLIPMVAWDKCKGDMDIVDLAGRECYAGFDLSSSEDLSSLALLFPLEDEQIAVLSYSWCPEEKVKNRARQQFPYDVWVRGDYLEATSGDQIDYARIQEKFAELSAIYDIREIGFDPAMGPQFGQDLQREYGEGQVFRVIQNFYSLSAPFKDLIRRIKLGKLIHFGNPVLRWAASNVAGHYDGRIPAGAKLEDYLDKVPVMPSKRKSADKIDPIAAMVIAHARLTAHPQESSGEVEFRII